MIESGLGMLANYHFARSVRPLTCGFDVYDSVDDGLDVGLLQKGSAMERQSDAIPGLGYVLVSPTQARGRAIQRCDD